MGKLNKREASYPVKITVHLMDFISGLQKSDFLQGKTSYAGTSYPGSTVLHRSQCSHMTSYHDKLSPLFKISKIYHDAKFEVLRAVSLKT